jgi:hypothetical protein
MPDVPDAFAPPPLTAPAEDESEEELITRLVDVGAQGNMDEINALDNKVLRGKIKAAVFRAKRAAK